MVKESIDLYSLVYHHHTSFFSPKSLRAGLPTKKKIKSVKLDAINPFANKYKNKNKAVDNKDDRGDNNNDDAIDLSDIADRLRTLSHFVLDTSYCYCCFLSASVDVLSFTPFYRYVKL